MVVKMRGRGHSRAWRECEIKKEGIVVGDNLSGFRGIGTGMPHRDPREKSSD
jgi:hypothetical protein